MADSEEVVHGSHISYLKFTGWDQYDILKQGVTLRSGAGMSSQPYDSLNLSFSVGDDSERVESNRELFHKEFSDRFDTVIACKQIHGCKIKYVRGGFVGENLFDNKIQYLGEGDGLMTDSEGILLTVSVADCLPVYLFDPEKQALGLLHVGWRGTAASVLKKGIGKMQELFGTSLSKLQIYLGPAIGKECYGVSEHIWKIVWDTVAHGKKEQLVNGSLNLELREINYLQAVEGGIEPGNISVSKYCTHCCSDLFYSHRASGGRTGRMLGFLGISKF